MHGARIGAATVAVLTASAAAFSQTAPADGGAIAPAPAGSAEPAPTVSEPPIVMLEGGVTATHQPAKPAEQERYQTQRSFAVLAEAGLVDGFGLGLRAGLPRVGLDLSAGYLPMLATYSQDAEHTPKYKVLSALQANATAYFGLYRTGPRAEIGVAVGYKYNTVLKHGVGVAYYAQYDLAEHWALHMFIGPAIFPRADRGIRDKAGWPDQGSVGSGISWLQGGVGVALAFFP